MLRSQPACCAEGRLGRAGDHTQSSGTTLAQISRQGDKELLKPVLRRSMKSNFIDLYPDRRCLQQPSSKPMSFLARPRIYLNFTYSFS